MKCPNCQSENREGIHFCETCGTKLPEKVLPKGPVCPICSNENRPGIQFCEYCGQELATDIKPTVKKIEQQFCPACGKSNRTGIKFCEYCGALLKEELIPEIEVTEIKQADIKAPEINLPASQTCSACGKINRMGIQFCEYCGNNLTEEKTRVVPKAQGQPCPACGKPNRTGIKFCEFCGESFAPKPKVLIQPKKKRSLLTYLVPGAAIVTLVLIVAIIGLQNNRTRDTGGYSPPALPDEATPAPRADAEIPPEAAQPGSESGEVVTFPDYGDLNNLSEPQAQTIANAFVDKYYPELALSEEPDVAYIEENGQELIEVVYSSEGTSESGVVIQQVIIIDINPNTGMVTILESN